MPASTSNSQISTGSIEVQSYAVNNAWIGDNIYFNGAGFVTRTAGYAKQIYFGAGSLNFNVASTSYAAGATTTLITALSILNSGAATFSSSVTVNGASATTSLNVIGSGPNGILLDQDSATAGASSRLFFKMNTQTYAMLADSNGLNFLSGATAGSSTGSPRMTITSGGNVCIGTTTAQDARLTLSYAGGVDWAVGPKSGTSSFAIIGSTGGGGGVYVSNGGTSWAAWSDRRVKKNIEDLEYGLDKILSISPVRFDYLTDKGDNSSRIGFIAQDVQEQMPEIVNYAYEDILGMSSTDLVPVLVKAIQELSAKVSLLENK
jgi:hypothetical protein